jgi:hypothetical protein
MPKNFQLKSLAGCFWVVSLGRVAGSPLNILQTRRTNVNPGCLARIDDGRAARENETMGRLPHTLVLIFAAKTINPTAQPDNKDEYAEHVITNAYYGRMKLDSLKRPKRTND